MASHGALRRPQRLPEQHAGGLIGLADGEPTITLALVFAATALLTSLATNDVAAVLVFPVALEAAQRIDVAAEPFILTLMVAASANFSTPIGYQTNLMAFNVGGYRFGDFVRIGVPLTLVVGLVTLLVVPPVWSFQRARPAIGPESLLGSPAPVALPAPPRPREARPMGSSPGATPRACTSPSGDVGLTRIAHQWARSAVTERCRRAVGRWAR